MLIVSLLVPKLFVSIPYRFNERYLCKLEVRMNVEFQFLIGSMKEAYQGIPAKPIQVSIPYRFNERRHFQCHAHLPE